MVVHYPRTVWKNSYAEHQVTGKTYNLKKNTTKDMEVEKERQKVGEEKLGP